MLRIHKARDNRGRLGVGMVVRDGRPASVSRSDDAEPDVRERRDGPGRPADRHGGGPVQDHESGRTAAHRLRAVSRKDRQRNQVDDFTDAGRTFESDIG